MTKDDLRVLNALSVAVNRRSSAAKPPVRPAPIASPRACQSRDLLPNSWSDRLPAIR